MFLQTHCPTRATQEILEEAECASLAEMEAKLKECENNAPTAPKNRARKHAMRDIDDFRRLISEYKKALVCKEEKKKKTSN